MKLHASTETLRSFGPSRAVTWMAAGQFAGGVTTATASGTALDSPTARAWQAPGPIGPEVQLRVTLVATQVACPQRAVGHCG